MLDHQLKALREEPQAECTNAQDTGIQDTGVEAAAARSAYSTGDGAQNSLAELQQKVIQQANVLAQQKAQIESLQVELATAQELLIEKEQRLALQSKKINGLLLECERLGAERELLRSLERRLLHISSNPHAALAELLAYQRFVQHSLGNDLHQAESHLKQLLHYSKEMSAPAHRAVHFLARKTGQTRLGRLTSSLMHGLYAVRSARR